MTESSPLAAAGLIRGDDDTIVAVATPPGRGALAVIRLSGPKAHEIGRALAARWPNEARSATVSPIRDRAGSPLDDGVVIRYDAPASYTGEDAVELTTHGGSIVPATVAAAAIELGARQAFPGEFTRRAVFNGKLDILQAEATGDLVGSTSRAAQRVALQQLHGGLSARINELRARLIEVEALIAYDIDFPEEDDGPIPVERVRESLTHVDSALNRLLATSRAGELVREGALVVFAGVPNAGKSSLFNALLGQERAIVTEIPGTTRDAIEAVLDMGRWPLRLVDTAGLRDSADRVERLGIAASTRYLQTAAVVLVCGATSADLRDALPHLGSIAAPLILVGTKADTGGIAAESLADLAVECGAAGIMLVSATERRGLEGLTALLLETLDKEIALPDTDAPILTRARHRHALETAHGEVAAFREAWDDGSTPAVIASVHLRSAVHALEELIGAVDVEQILDELFRRFCVGK